MPELPSQRITQAPLRWRRGFWSLVVTQFQNAFNDNALKFLVIYIVVAMNFESRQRDQLILVVGALFALPFIFFSMSGGYLADRYSKRSVTIGVKVMEVGVMLFAIASLALRNLPMECGAVFLISSQSALFGPSKYGLLPEILPEHELSWGNGIIELGTFIGSIAATMVAGILAERYQGREAISGVILLGCTMVGLATSFGITRVPAADPGKKIHWNPLGELSAQMRVIWADRTLAWAVWGNTYLFFLAALLQFTIVVYGHDTLRIDDAHISYLQAAVGIGIGIGSVAAGYLSGGKIEYGLIPLGALGMTVFGALLYSPGHTILTAGVHLALLGFFGGFFAVPLSALIQHRPQPDDKGGVIAAANLLSFVGIFIAAGAYYLFASGFHQTGAGIFLDGAILTLLMTGYSIYLLPDSLVRLGLWIATHSLYRMRVEGRENVPERGGALLVARHMSIPEALLLIASSERPIRLLIREDIYNRRFVKPVAKILGAIPVSSPLSSQCSPGDSALALRDARNAIYSGELVCISADGEITGLEQRLPFPLILKHILEGIEAPIVPVNVAGSSAANRTPRPITVNFGKAMAPSSSALEVQEAVQA